MTAEAHKKPIPQTVLKGAKALVVGMLTAAAQKAPLGELVDVMDVGFACAYLATPYARCISGDTTYVDSGVDIMA